MFLAGPTASAEWGSTGGLRFIPVARVSLLDPVRLTQAEMLRNEAANKALPASPMLAIPASPFSLMSLGADALAAASALDCMTAAIYYEAANEPISGQRAVAQVIINRVRHPAFPNSVCGVVFEGSSRATGCQFTFTCDGSLARTPSPALWLRARAVASAALGGFVETSVGHATHYHAVYVMPYWAPSLTKLTTIGSHIFYQWKGQWSRPSTFIEHYSAREVMPVSARSSLAAFVLTPASLEDEALLASVPTDTPAKGETLRSEQGLALSAAPLAQMRSVSAPPASNLSVKTSELIESKARLKDSPPLRVSADQAKIVD